MNLTAYLRQLERYADRLPSVLAEWDSLDEYDQDEFELEATRLAMEFSTAQGLAASLPPGEKASTLTRLFQLRWKFLMAAGSEDRLGLRELALPDTSIDLGGRENLTQLDSADVEAVAVAA